MGSFSVCLSAGLWAQALTIGPVAYSSGVFSFYMINKDEVKKLRKEGLSFSDIAWRLGCSRQRINQIFNPEKHRARNDLARAIIAGGVIIKNCYVCGKSADEAHHEDYSKPLDVIWLCTKHHKEYHKLKRQKSLKGVVDKPYRQKANAGLLCICKGA